MGTLNGAPLSLFDASFSAHQAHMTRAQSLIAIQTVLSASFGCIMYLRNLLPEDNFCNARLVVGDSEAAPGSSQTTDGGGRVSNFKIMAVRRGFSSEGDLLLDYLEKGVFHALEKQYLKSFILALYLDKEDPNNIVEAYTFSFHYHKLADSSVRIPALSITDHQHRLRENSRDPFAKAITSHRAPRLSEVKLSVRNVVKNLIAITQQLETLPKRKLVTFKLAYNESCPDDYEPPMFIPAPQNGSGESSCLVFTTHDVDEPPESISIGTVDTRHLGVAVQVETIASYLPNPEIEDGVVQGISYGGHPNGIRKDDLAALNEQHEIQRLDGLQRKVAWAAEDSIQEGAGDSPQDHPPRSTLLGERNPDGTFAPLGRQYEGRPRVVPDDVPLAPSVDTTQATEGTQLIDDIQSSIPSTPPRSRALALVPSSVETSPLSETEEDFGMQKLALSEGPPQEMSQVLDFETQRMGHEQAQVPNRVASVAESNVGASKEVGGPDIDMETPVVTCECDVAADAEDYSICLCEGPCKRWVHLWCHGYHSDEDKRLPETFKCFECRLRGDPAIGLFSERKILEMIAKYKDLALFRRALKIIEVENPENVTGFRKLVGCSPAVARQLWKRLEVEGFIALEHTQSDSIGLLETITNQSQRRDVSKQKARQRRTGKSRYRAVTSAVANRARKRYFDPSEDTERKFVGLGQRVRTWFETLGEYTDEQHQDDINTGSNIRKPSTKHDPSGILHSDSARRFSRPDIEMHSSSPPDLTITAPPAALEPNPGVISSYDEASLQNTALEESQTQEETMPADWNQPGLEKGKRRRSGRFVNEDPRPLKKLKYSVAREPVELEG